MTFIAVLVGMLTAHATDLWIDAAQRGSENLVIAKQELLASAGLANLHHAVYAQVGEARWEREVKPAFLGAITRATVRETGDLLPSWHQVVDWVRAHPEDARRMLKDAAAIP